MHNTAQYVGQGGRTLLRDIVHEKRRVLCKIPAQYVSKTLQLLLHILSTLPVQHPHVL